MIIVIASPVFLYCNDRYFIKDIPMLRRLSICGQKYSMGIFILHQAVCLAVSFVTSTLWRLAAIGNPSIFLYVSQGLLTFFATFIFAYLLYKSPLKNIIS